MTMWCVVYHESYRTCSLASNQLGLQTACPAPSCKRAWLQEVYHLSLLFVFNSSQTATGSLKKELINRVRSKEKSKTHLQNSLENPAILDSRQRKPSLKIIPKPRILAPFWDVCVVCLFTIPGLPSLCSQRTVPANSTEGKSIPGSK